MNTEGEYTITRYYGDGSFAAPYEHRKQSETSYIDGKRDGLRKVWYSNGQLMKQLEYQDGQLVGVVRTWYEDGSRDLEYIARPCCEMCGEVMTKNDHAYSDICPDCLEG